MTGTDDGTAAVQAVTSGAAEISSDNIVLNGPIIQQVAQALGDFIYVLDDIGKNLVDAVGNGQFKSYGGPNINGGQQLSRRYDQAAEGFSDAAKSFGAVASNLLNAILDAMKAYKSTDAENASTYFGKSLDGNAFNVMTTTQPPYYRAPPTVAPSGSSFDAQAGAQQAILWKTGGMLDDPNYGDSNTFADRTADLGWAASHGGDDDVKAAAKVAGSLVHPDEGSYDNPFRQDWATYNDRHYWAEFKARSAGGNAQCMQMADYWDGVINNLKGGVADVQNRAKLIGQANVWTGSGAGSASGAISAYAGSLQDLIDVAAAISGSLKYTAGWVGRFHDAMPATICNAEGSFSMPSPDEVRKSGYDDNEPMTDPDPDITDNFAPDFGRIYNAGVIQSLSPVPGVLPSPGGNPAPATITNPTTTTDPNTTGGPGTTNMPSPIGPGTTTGSSTAGSGATTGPTDPTTQGISALQNGVQAATTGLQGLQSLIGQSGSQQSASDTGAGSSDTGAGQSTSDTGAGAGSRGQQQASQAAQQLAGLLGAPQGVDQASNAAKQVAGMTTPPNTKNRTGPVGIAGAGGGGGYAGAGAAEVDTAAPSESSNLFPRASVAAGQDEEDAVAQSTEAEESAQAARAGQAPMAGMPGAGLGGASAGQQGERKRADFLDSKKHLEEGLGDDTLAVMPVVGREE